VGTDTARDALAERDAAFAEAADARGAHQAADYRAAEAQDTAGSTASLG
jgi:hypothetical protein